MRNFKHGDRKSFMHKAICNACNQECEVPFRPTSGRPVFCSHCFENNRDPHSRQSGERHSRRPDFSDKRKYTAVCDRCGNECEVPFRPTGEKPVYCNQCFKKNPHPDYHQPQEKKSTPSKEEFALLNRKLDQILKILNPAAVLNEEKSSHPQKTAKKIPPLKKNLPQATTKKKTPAKKSSPKTASPKKATPKKKK